MKSSFSDQQTREMLNITACSVQFRPAAQACPTLRPHEPQHARPACPSPAPGVYSNSCPSSRWCHLILCRPLLLLPPISPSIRVFSNKSALYITRVQIVGWPYNDHLFIFTVSQMRVRDFSSVQSLTHVQLSATPWIAARQASLSITNSRSLPNPCPLCQWCHPTSSSSIVPFSSCT